MIRRQTPLGVNVICAAEFPAACRRAAIEVIMASAVPFSLSGT
jgi:hypothetical protein